MRRTQPSIAGFDDGGRRPQAKAGGQLLEAGEGKEVCLPWSPQEE